MENFFHYLTKYENIYDVYSKPCYREAAPFKLKQGQQNHRSSAKNSQLNSKTPTVTGHFNSYNHQKWLLYKMLSSKTIKNV